MSQTMEALADLSRRVTSMDAQVEEEQVTEDRVSEDVLVPGGDKLPAAEHRNFDTFYAAHRDQIARALSLSLRNPDLGAEAADEAFVRACQRWAEVSTFTNPQGWVYRVGMNWARSWLRRARREREKRPLLAEGQFAEDEIVDVVEALAGEGVAVKFPTPEAFASGNKTLEVLMPEDEEVKVSVAHAMGKALSNIEWLTTEPAQ